MIDAYRLQTIINESAGCISSANVPEGGVAEVSSQYCIELLEEVIRGQEMSSRIDSALVEAALTGPDTVIAISESVFATVKDAFKKIWEKVLSFLRAARAKIGELGRKLWAKVEPWLKRSKAETEKTAKAKKEESKPANTASNKEPEAKEEKQEPKTKVIKMHEWPKSQAVQNDLVSLLDIALQQYEGELGVFDDELTNVMQSMQELLNMVLEDDDEDTLNKLRSSDAIITDDDTNAVINRIWEVITGGTTSFSGRTKDEVIENITTTYRGEEKDVELTYEYIKDVEADIPATISVLKNIEAAYGKAIKDITMAKNNLEKSGDKLVLTSDKAAKNKEAVAVAAQRYKETYTSFSKITSAYMTVFNVINTTVTKLVNQKITEQKHAVDVYNGTSNGEDED